MATRTISNTGGNFNSTGAWVEGIVPTNADAIVATGTSGQLTVNVASVCQSINLTGYTNTLTMNSTLTIGLLNGSDLGGLILSTGMTLAGTTGTFILLGTNAGTTPIDFKGKIVTCSFTIAPTTVMATFNILTSMRVNGVTSITTSPLVINGLNLYCYGTFTCSIRCAGTATIYLAGTGNWTGSNTATNFMTNTVVVAATGTYTTQSVGPNFSGTINISAGNLASVATSNWYTSGNAVVYGKTPVIQTLSTSGSILTIDNPLFCATAITLAAGSSTSIFGGQKIYATTLSLANTQVFTHDSSACTISNLSFSAGTTSYASGASYNINNLFTGGNSTGGFYGGAVVNINNRLENITTLTQPGSFKSWNVGTPFTMNISAGASVRSYSYQYSDVNVSGQPIYNFWGSTLTRTNGIYNSNDLSGTNSDGSIT